MNKKGYMPFTVVSLILLITSIFVIGYYKQQEHRQNMKAIKEKSEISVSTSVLAKRNELERLALSSLYEALWFTGKNADSYASCDQRENQLEYLTSLIYEIKLESIISKSKNIHSDVQIEWEGGKPKINLTRRKKEYPILSVEFPENVYVNGRTRENSFVYSTPVKKLEIKVDSRFFLLQERMKKFRKQFGKVKDRWMYAEYAKAYSQAWLSKKLDLKSSHSKFLFQASLASHEMDKFGSTDYVAVGKSLLDNGPEKKNWGKDGRKSIPKQPIREFKRNIEKACSKLKKSENNLRECREKIEEAVEFSVKSRIRAIIWRLANLRNELENMVPEKIKNEFENIFTKFENPNSPRKNLIEKAKNRLKKAEKSADRTLSIFLKGLEKIEKRSENNVFLKQLNRDLTKNENHPSIKEQVRNGIGNIRRSLDIISQNIDRAEVKYNKQNEIDTELPPRYKTDLSEALKENRELAGKIIVRIKEEMENILENIGEENKDALRSLNAKIRREIENQTSKPKNNWTENYLEYPGPNENSRKRPEQKTAEKYVIYPGNGTIEGVKKKLKNVKNHLKTLIEISNNLKKSREKSEKFDIGKNWENLLPENYKRPDSSVLSRMKFYELSPPSPILENPNISVYHKLKIEEVDFSREDPLGLVEKSAPPTPIYLWFIDTTIYWAQWSVKITLKTPPEFEILDYPNQTIPRPIKPSSEEYIHKALPYFHKIEKTEFDFRLIVLNLRNFRISPA